MEIFNKKLLLKIKRWVNRKLRDLARCDFKCSMCNQWQSEQEKEWEWSEVEGYPRGTCSNCGCTSTFDFDHPAIILVSYEVHHKDVLTITKGEGEVRVICK